MKVLFVFLDGVGIGPDDPDLNPFLRAELPILRTLLGGEIPHLGNLRIESSDSPFEAVAFPVDANLDTEGTPQSGTGQVALLTGENAARIFGRHFGPWTPVKLRPLVEEHSLLRKAVERGRSASFANAYPRGWPGKPAFRRVAGPPLAARGAGLLTRHEEALAQGDAVASEILNDGWRRHLGFTDLPTPTAAEAGETLGRLATRVDLTLFAHYGTDHAGHEEDVDGACAALERVDAFLGGALRALPSDALLLIASDHGNIEDVRAGHTRNPVLGVLVGPDAVARSRGISAITHVAPAVERWLEE